MEGCAEKTTTADPVVAKRTVLKTNEEKGSELLQRFVQQTDRKKIWMKDKQPGKCWPKA